MRLFYFVKNILKNALSLFKQKKLNGKKISEIDFYFNAKNEVKNNAGNKDFNKSVNDINLKGKDVFEENKINTKSIKRKRIRGVASFVICLFSIIFLVVTPNYVFNKKSYQTDVSNLLLSQSDSGTVLNLWHIETFEGGSASRAKYLEKQAIAFNKSQKDCFIVVKTLTENQLFLNLEQNKYPDLFSFGVGAGYMISSILSTLPQNDNVRDDLQEYGKINGEILAYPYILGGYLTITREKDFNQDNPQDNFENVPTNKNSKQKLGFGVSTGDFTNNLVSLNFQNTYQLKKVNMFEANSTYDAYVAFVQNKFKTLIGTTRDLARCKNRELNGNLDSCVYSYLGGYSDLVQYIGVNKNITKSKLKMANSFAKFLTEIDAQKAISHYGLFGVTMNKIYLDDYYSDFEDVLMKKITSVNVFDSLKQLESQKQDSISKLLN